MKYVLAVSGGVDSVVLLDLMAKTNHTLVVAHVDHGIRPESADDELFVRLLANKYGLPYVSKRFELGKNSSEERAREARYSFLREQAASHEATIMTAHHAGDVIETIALNLERGTGWRGLAVMHSSGIKRPLVKMTKNELIDYAVRNRLEWVEDHTNGSDKYQRNRLRKKINRLVDEKVRTKLLQLRLQQIELRGEIERELIRFTPLLHQRYFLSQVDSDTAEELLASLIYQKTGVSTTRPQRKRALLAVKTAKAGSVYQVGSGIELHFTSRNLSVKVV